MKAKQHLNGQCPDLKRDFIVASRLVNSSRETDYREQS